MTPFIIEFGATRWTIQAELDTNESDWTPKGASVYSFTVRQKGMHELLVTGTFRDGLLWEVLNRDLPDPFLDLIECALRFMTTPMRPIGEPSLLEGT